MGTSSDLRAIGARFEKLAGQIETAYGDDPTWRRFIAHLEQIEADAGELLIHTYSELPIGTAITDRFAEAIAKANQSLDHGDPRPAVLAGLCVELLDLFDSNCHQDNALTAHSVAARNDGQLDTAEQLGRDGMAAMLRRRARAFAVLAMSVSRKESEQRRNMPIPYEYGTDIYWLWAWGFKINELLEADELLNQHADVVLRPDHLALDSMARFSVRYPEIIRQIQDHLAHAELSYSALCNGDDTPEETSMNLARDMDSLRRRIWTGAEAIAEAEAETDNHTSETPQTKKLDKRSSDGFIEYPSDESAYIPFTKLYNEHTPDRIAVSQKQLRTLLDNHKCDIRQWRPQTNRRNIHLRDWLDFIEKEGTVNADDVDEIERRKSEAQARKRAGH